MHCGVMDFLVGFDRSSCAFVEQHALEAEMVGDLKTEWLQTSWIVSCAKHHRVVNLHAVPEEEPIRGAKFFCTALDARAASYDMREVTGLDKCVLLTLIKQKMFPMKLREIIIAIEGLSLDHINLVCAGGTHRSVATAYALMLLVYPNARFYPHTERVRQAAAEKLV